MNCHLSDMPAAPATSGPRSRVCASPSRFASRGSCFLFGVAP